MLRTQRGGTSNPASGKWNECGDSDDFCIRYERKFHLRQNETGFSNGVCVIVRTYTKQGLQLRTQMHAWNIIAERTQRHVHVFLVDTDPDDSREQGTLFLERVVPVEGKAHAHIVRLGAKFVLDKGLYGYDATQLVMDEIRKAFNTQCRSYLVTNGDNYHSVEVLQNTGLNDMAPMYTEMIAFDFITHHKRRNTEGQRVPNQSIVVDFARGKIDLRSVIVDRSGLDRCPDARFNEQNAKQNNFAIDWFYIHILLSCNGTTHVVHQTLFMHQ